MNAGSCIFAAACFFIRPAIQASEKGTLMANTEIRLYCFIFCVVVACCLPPLAVWSRTDKPANIEDAHTFEHLWQATPADQRRALPNNSAPPERRLPRMQLPPLPPQEEGSIRRVMLPEGVKAVALTFDLCELATTTTGYDADAINFLRREHIPATLFMGGKWMRPCGARQAGHGRPSVRDRQPCLVAR